jgi:septum formation protein
MTTPDLILASTSVYRRALLEKLALPFRCVAPHIDETPQTGEEAIQLVQRLALEKAQAVAKTNTTSWIIGSDQVCTINGEIVGKPGSASAAIAQLQAAAGQKISFYTGLCLFDTALDRYQLLAEPFHVHFRALSLSQIERYVSAEKPFDCAGSFKSEGLGISLFQQLEGRDPNTLIGLPLIALVDMFAAWGLELPLPQKLG